MRKTLLLATLASVATHSAVLDPRISVGRPILGSPAAGVAGLVDGSYGSPTWSYTPGSWAAIDLGTAPSQVLVVWSGTGGDWSDSIPGQQHCTEDLSFPSSFSISTASATTNGLDGTWTSRLQLAGNVVTTRAHLVETGGDRWLKLQMASGSGALDEIEVFDATDGARDSWFLLGTSISEIAQKNFPSDSTFRAMVRARAPDRDPAVVRGGVSCINSSDMVGAFGGYLAMAGTLHYWAIEMGGNDAWGGGSAGVPNFAANLHRFVDSARAHGIEPILARPTATDSSIAGWQVDPGYPRTVDSLTALLHLVPGPDFYGHFLSHLRELGPDGVHPGRDGAYAVRRLWAEVAAATNPGSNGIRSGSKIAPVLHGGRVDALGRPWTLHSSNPLDWIKSLPSSKDGTE